MLILHSHCTNTIKIPYEHCIKTIVSTVQSKGFGLFAGMALEEEGVYAAVPRRLVLCKDSALKTTAGVDLRLPWPSPPEIEVEETPPERWEVN
jgi:hypothetical protein